MNKKRQWVPEIMYEEYDHAELTNSLPFIQIPEDKEMPNVLFFFGSKATGEEEPDMEGNPQPIVEMEVYQFACMKYLKDGLDEEAYDKVRAALQLLPLKEAQTKGRKESRAVVQEIANKKNEAIHVTEIREKTL
jgi:hypothetical protein